MSDDSLVVEGVEDVQDVNVEEAQQEEQSTPAPYDITELTSLPKVQEVRDIVTEVSDAQTADLLREIDSSINSLDMSLSSENESLAERAAEKAVQKASGNDPEVQTVEISQDQWDRAEVWVRKFEQAFVLQNALLLFTLVMCSGLIGMRFFAEFSRGFRRG